LFKGFFSRKKKNQAEEALKELLQTAQEAEEKEQSEAPAYQEQPEMQVPAEPASEQELAAVEEISAPEPVEEPMTEPEAEIEEPVVEDAAEEIIEESAEGFEEVAENVPVEVEEIVEEPVEEAEEKPEKKGFFARLKESLGKTRTAISDKVDAVLLSLGKIDEDLYEELEEALVMSDIGAETSAFIIDELKEKAKSRGITEAAELKGVLREIVADILSAQDCELHLSEKPAVIMVIGVNGVGKTTSIGKLAHYYKSQGKQVILAAGDTFRAAAIDQLEIWAERAGVSIVKHQEGSDPSAVVFDSIQAAKSRGADVVICDTAGRLHNKKNLMEELKKTARVVERETGGSVAEVLLVLDASTGQNALVQAREFARAAGITGVILTKLDGTAKGGVILALSREQGIGVKFIGVGEQIDDLRPFDPQSFAEALFPVE